MRFWSLTVAGCRIDPSNARIHYTFSMKKRLHVLLSEEDYLEIQSLARLRRVTVEEWVRQALRKAIEDHRSTVDAKLRAIADASRHRCSVR